jgi:glucose-1-phosphate thymidylyltransferase
VSPGGRPTRAVILAGGRGTRMQRPDDSASLSPAQAAAADEGSKGMMPMHGRPFLDYVLGSLADAGIEEVCLVTPPGGGAIREHYGRPAQRRVAIAFAEQSSPRGSGDALLAAEPFAGGHDFVALNSDNLYPVSAIRALRALDGSGLAVFERARLLATSNFTRERVAAFATLRVSEDGWLEAIVEKPLVEKASEPRGEEKPVLLSMNLWRFSPGIFEACREVPLSSRGERELPQAVGWAIAVRGERFHGIPCKEGVLDLSTRADVAAVERLLEGVEVRP